MKKEIKIGFDIDGVIFKSLGKGADNKIIEKFANLIHKFQPFQKIIVHIYKNKKPNIEIIDLISKLKEDGIKIVLITGFQGDRELIVERLERFGIKYDELYNFADRPNKSLNNKKGKVKRYKVDLIRELGLEFYIDNRKDIIGAIPEGIGVHYTTNSELKDVEEKLFKRIIEIRVLWESEITEIQRINELMQETQKKEAETEGVEESKELTQEVQEDGKEWREETGNNELKQEIQNKEGQIKTAEKGEINREFKRKFKIR